MNMNAARAATAIAGHKRIFFISAVMRVITNIKAHDEHPELSCLVIEQHVQADRGPDLVCDHPPDSTELRKAGYEGRPHGDACVHHFPAFFLALNHLRSA